MALNTQRKRPWQTRLHLLARLLGLTGLLAALAGLGIGLVDLNLGRDADDQATPYETGTAFLEAVQGTPSEPGPSTTTAYLFAVGAGVVVFALLIELLVAARKAAFRHGAAGLNALTQRLLAIGLLLGINYLSFHHFARLDCTEDQQFTLDEEVVRDLEKLRGTTTIVILQTQRGSEQKEKQLERYTLAARTILVEKVRDLADQLRALSSQQLRVVILDPHTEEYEERLKSVTRGHKALADAIEAAPESSLLFHTVDDRQREHVQRLSFDAFLQLDVAASRKANDGKGNLVLRRKGVEPIVRRIVNLEERRPVIGLLAVHPLLSSRGTVSLFALKKMRQSLESFGFEVRDIFLKNDQNGEPAAATFEELRVEELRDSIADLKDGLPILEKDLKTFQAMYEDLPKANLNAFSRKYEENLRGRIVPEDQRRELRDQLKEVAGRLNSRVEEVKKRLAKEEKELQEYNAEAVDAARRMSDLRGKLDNMLAGCDLLILSRYTRLPMGPTIDDQFNEFFKLDDAQVGALKDYIKAGKPLLCCLGPTNEAGDPESGPPPERKDTLEKMLSQLGVHLSQQTVLFNAQRPDFAEQRRRRFQRMNVTAVPSVEFMSDRETGEPNRLGESLRLAEELTGADLRIELHYPRPVTVDTDRGYSLPRYRKILDPVLAHAPLGPLGVLPALILKPDAPKKAERHGEFLFSNKESWNDEHPFPTNKRPEPSPPTPELDDPARGTPDEKRTGPFALGVALATEPPADWYSASEGKPRSTRLVVIGHGGVFVDETMSPAREKLLLDSCNWLLGRDDLLNAEAAAWRYPRLEMSERDRKLWLSAASVGLATLLAYFGLVVLLTRRAL